jgi:hypothetical protein
MAKFIAFCGDLVNTNIVEKVSCHPYRHSSCFTEWRVSLQRKGTAYDLYENFDTKEAANARFGELKELLTADDKKKEPLPEKE